jgi:hypothetical protein
MSQRLTDVRPVLSVVVVLATYALVGLGAGWIWHELWQPAQGVVLQGAWYPDGEGLRQDFSGTGLYVLVAAGCGLALGSLFAVLGGARPVLTLVVCLAGSVLAAWLMLRMGERLGPADPHELAADADDGTALPSALRVSGMTPLLAFPVGTLAGLGLVFMLFTGNTAEAGLTGQPRR